MSKRWVAGAAAMALLATPALADVKTGVEAWQHGDYRTAVDEWRGPAVAGDADAQFNLGQAYKLGRGVPVDPVLAESWFRKAALQGHQQAETNYGIALFQAGRAADAAPWLEKAVSRGEPRAALVLGTMLFNGDGVPRDYPRAYALMTVASQAGLPSASQTLAQMDGFISAADREKGVQLAAEYERSARTAPLSAHTGVDDEDHPRVVVSSQPGGPASSRPGFVQPVPAPPSSSGADHPAPPRAVAHAERPAPTPAPTSTLARSGPWRIQLGAFANPGNAEALWSHVRARVGGRPSYVRSGPLTRLQVAGFASRAEADRVCASAKAAGSACVIVKP